MSDPNQSSCQNGRGIVYQITLQQQQLLQQQQQQQQKQLFQKFNRFFDHPPPL